MFYRSQEIFKIRDTLSIAGWMFADLLLGLSMFFLVFNTVGQKPIEPMGPTFTMTSTISPSPTFAPATPTYGPSVSPTPTSKPVMTPTPTSPVPGLGSAQCYNIILKSKDIKAQIDTLIAQLKYQLPNDPKFKAGLVLVWAYGNGVQEGVTMAGEIGKVIKDVLPASFGQDTQFKSLSFIYGDMYQVQIEVYFFNTGLWKNAKEIPCGYTK